MSKAKKKGLFAFLLALLASAIVSGALLLSPATANAAAGTETADDGTVTISNVRYGNELFSAVTRGGTAGQPLVIRFAENTGMNFTVGEGGNLYDSATGEPLGAGNFAVAESDKAPAGMVKAAVIMDGTYYGSIAEAIEAAGSKACTITLAGDLAENVVIPEGATVTLDLAGYTLSSLSTAADSRTIFNSGTLTVEDGTVIGSTSAIFNGPNSESGYVPDTALYSATLTLDNVDLKATGTVGSFALNNSYSIINSITGGSIIAADGCTAISNSGYIDSISGTDIIAEDGGFGSFTIAGTAIILNGDGPLSANDERTGVIGSVENCVITGDIRVATNEENATGSIVIADCTLNGDFIVDERMALFATESGWAAGTPEFVATQGAVAVVGNVAYATLEEAVAAVPADGVQVTITLIGGENGVITGNGVKFNDGQNIVIDFNGKTYNVDETVGSAGTETNGFQLLKGSVVTLKNGAMTSDTAKILLQNYCNLTLDGMTLNLSDKKQIQYVISNNFGNTVITGKTQIIAPEGCVAFDVFYGLSETYYDGVSVTFDENFTGRVEGTVEYGAQKANENWQDKSKLTIENGNFDITFKVNTGDATEANITANGGNFGFVLPEEYLGAGNSLYTDGEGGYAVAPANEAPEGMKKVAVLMDGKGYATIAEAIAAAQGDEIELSLYDDLVENVVIPAGKTVVLDLAGKTISAEKDNTIENKGTLTINGEGSIVADGMRTALRNRSGATLTVNGGTISSDNGTALNSAGTLIVNGGTFTTDGGGQAATLTGTTVINNGEFITNTPATSTASNAITAMVGELTIKGGTFEAGKQAVAASNGATVIIEDGDFSVRSYANGNILYADNAVLTVSGGTFKAPNSEEVETVNVTASGSAQISGGEFSTMPKAAYFAEGYIAYCVDFGIYKVKKGTFAIEVGEYQFVGNDLRQAILFAKDGETVKLLGDIITTMTSATVKSEITIDLNGKTITAAQDMSFILNLKAEKDITIKNGRLSGKAINVVAAADDVHINISGITVERLNDKYLEESDNQYKGVTPPVLVIGAAPAEYITAEYITNATLENVHINVYVNAQGYSGQKAVEIYNANVTIKDSSVFADSKEDITINGVAIKNSDVTVTSSEIVSTTGSAMGFLGALSFEDAVAGDAENFNTLTVENSMLTGYTIALSGNGGEGNSGTVINVIDSQLNSTGKIGPAIYHPQYGIINISGDKTVLKGSSGIEIRAGIANISGGEFTANAETFSAVASGNGTTTDGAAVAVVQHTTKLPVQVNITGGTFNTETESGKTLYQADLQNNGEEAVAKIAMDVSGGEFNGAVESKNVKGFITGGRFAELPAEDAFAEGLAGELYDGYYMVVNAEDVNAAASIADRLSAQSDLRAYLASFGLTITDMQLVAESDELAADIVAAYDEIFAASTKEGVAEALAAAMDAADAYRANLAAEKAAAIEELNTYAAGTEELAAVAVPTYAVSAINGAVTVAEVNAYVDLAKAEMDDIRAQRAEAEQQYQAVNDRFDAIMQALGITGSAEEGYTSEVLDKLNGVIEALGITEADGAWSTDLLDGITQDLETANENIAAMQELLGTAADEATAQTIIGMIKATQNSVAKAEDNIKQAISDLSSDIQTKYEALMQAVGELPADVAGALDGRLSELEGTVSGLDTTVGNLGTDIGELETAVAGLTTAQQQLTKAINEYKTAVDGILADMTGKFAEISGKLDNLPTNDELAQALTNALSGVTEQLTLIKAEVDKIDGLDEAVIGGVSEKIDAAFASFTQTFNTAMNGINTKLDSLDSAIAALPEDSDIAALSNAIEAARSAAETAGDKVDSLGITLGGRLDSVDTALRGIDGTIDGLTTAQNAMNEAMTAFRSELNTTLSGVNEAIAAVKADVKALADTAAADKLELLEKLNALQTSADAIEQAIASLDGDSSADLSAISAELAALQTSLGDVADVVDEVALGNTNSSSSFAGIYVYLSAILVLAAVILIVLAVKKRR